MSLGNCESLFNVHLSDRAELLFVYLSNYVRASKLPFAGIDFHLLHTEARAPVGGFCGGFSQTTVITGSPRLLLMCKSKYMLDPWRASIELQAMQREKNKSRENEPKQVHEYDSPRQSGASTRYDCIPESFSHNQGEFLLQ